VADQIERLRRDGGGVLGRGEQATEQLLQLLPPGGGHAASNDLCDLLQIEVRLAGYDGQVRLGEKRATVHRCCFGSDDH